MTNKGKKDKAGKAGPASKKPKTSYPLTRSDEILENVLETFLDSQTKEKDQLTDVHLVCRDGVIPVHAIILKAASKLFAAALESQGDSYTSVRKILLPDYCVQEMRDVVQVIYSGTARFSENEDAEGIEEILKELCVDNVKNSKTKSKQSTDSNVKLVRCYLTKRINQPVAGTEKDLSELKALFGSQVEEEKKKNPSPSNSKKLRKRKVQMKNSSGASSSESDSDYSPERPRKSQTKSSNLVKLKSPRVVAERLVINSTKTTAVSTVPNTVSIVPAKKTSFYSYKGNQYKNNEEDNEPDSDDWEEPDYNNKAWFETEASRCQKCQKGHASPAAASTCITSHGRLRCYFCFAIAKNTEKLFEHFTKKHKQAGRENCLMCPFCEQTVPFKSVSCHVISIHLSDNRGQVRNPIGQNGPGRPPAIATVAPAVNKALTKDTATNAASTTPLKKSDKNAAAATPLTKSDKNAAAATLKTKSDKNGVRPQMVSNESAPDDGMLRVGDLDVTIRNKMGNGKIMVYHLQKDRSVP